MLTKQFLTGKLKAKQVDSLKRSSFFISLLIIIFDPTRIQHEVYVTVVGGVT